MADRDRLKLDKNAWEQMTLYLKGVSMTSLQAGQVLTMDI